jgi:CO dehydrogenase/acetyl-CoA synthase delta subunit
MDSRTLIAVGIALAVLAAVHTRLYSATLQADKTLQLPVHTGRTNTMLLH